MAEAPNAQHDDRQQDKRQQKDRERPAPKKAAPPAPALRSVEQILRVIEQSSHDPEQLLSIIGQGVQAGLIQPGALGFIEGFIQGGQGALSARPIDPSVQERLERTTGVSVEGIGISEALPGFMQQAGAKGAAFGETVVTAPGMINEASGQGMELLTHEVTHIGEHRAAGTPAAIHFDVGGGPGEGAARAAADLVAIEEAHGAELAEIVSLLSGHTSDKDVHKVLNVLSHWDSGTIVSAWKSLDAKWLEDIIDNLATEHFSQHPREMLATIKAVSVNKRYKMILDLTDEGWFDSVSDAEAVQVLYLLQGISQSYQDRFRQEDGGKRYKRFKSKLPGDAAATLQKGIDPKLEAKLKAQENDRREDAAAEQRAQGQGEGLSEEEEALAAVTNASEKRIRELLATGFTDWAVTDTEAKEVLSVFGELLGSPEAAATSGTPQVGAVVRALEKDGLMEKWLGNLPEAAAYAKENVATLIAVLSHRPPETALQHAENLLSYGLFDWAVTDAEAVLAYHLIRALPPSAQETFRERDGAQWFVRMEHNLTDEVLTGEVGAEGGYGLVDEHETEEAQLAAEEERAQDTKILQEESTALEQMVQRFEDVSSDNAPALLTSLVESGEEQCRAFTRHLDRLALLQELLDALADKRWTPDNRSNVLTVLRHRDPMHNISMIQDVLSYGLFDWEINSDEARLAYEMIRALPEENRQEFIEEDPSWFSRMDSNISLELRESEEFGTYEGGDGDREALIAQLFEDEIWTAGQSGRLEMVLRMLVQAGERDAALPIVQERWTEANAEMFQGLGFPSEGRALPENVIDETDTNTVKMIVQGIDALVKSEDIDMPFGDTMGISGVQMAEVQEAMGGHLSGIRFGAGTKDEEDADKQDAGEVDVSFNMDDGHLVFKAANLPVESINVVQGSTTIRAGAGQILGADFDIKWGTPLSPETHLEILLASLVLNDIMIVHKDQMFGIGAVSLSGFGVSGDRVGPLPPAASKATALEKVGDFLLGVVKVLASIIESLDDVVGDIAPLNPLLDAASDDAGIAEQIQAAFAQDFNVTLKLDGLSVTDIVDSKGGHIGGVEVGAINLDVVLSQAAKARQQIQDLRDGAQDRSLSDAEQAEITRLEALVASWEAKQARHGVLVGKQGAGETLNAEEQGELEQLTRELSSVELDGKIEGGVHLKDVNIAGVSADQLDAEGVTIQGDVAGVNLGLTDRDQLSNLASLEGGADAFAEQGSGATLGAASVTGSDIEYSSGARRDEVLAAAITDLEKLEKPTDAQKASLGSAREEFAGLQPLVAEFEGLHARIRELNGGERARYTELRALLTQAPEASVARFDAQNVEVSADLGSDAYSVSADSVSATDVDAAGYHVDAVEANGVSANADLTEGRESVDFKVESGSATNVTGEVGTVGSVDLSGLGGKAHRVDETTIRLEEFTLGNASAAGVDVNAGGVGLEVKDAVTLSGVEVVAEITLKADAQGKATSEIEDVNIERAHVDALAGNGIAVDMPGTLEMSLKEGALNGVTLEGFKLSDNTFASLDVQGAGVSGLEAGMASGITASIGNLNAAGIALSGVTAGAYTFSMADLSGGDLDVDMDGIGLDIKRLDGGAVQGLTFDANSGAITFPEITLASMQFGDIHYAGGGKVADIKGGVNAHTLKIKGTANLLTEDERKKQGLGADASALESLHIDSLTLVSADASDVTYTDDNAGQKITMKSGHISDFSVTDFDLNAMSGDVKMGASGVEGLSAAIGETLTATGDLAVAGIDLGMLSDSKMSVDVDNLTADMLVTLKDGDNINVIDLATGDQGLSGSVGMDGDAITLKDLSLGELQLTQIDWTAGSKHITTGAALSVRDVTVDASVVLAPDGSSDPLKSATISKLHVGGVDVDNLTFRDGDMVVTINEQNKRDHGLDIRDIDVTDFNWTPSSMTGDVSVGSAIAPQLSARMGADLSAGMSLSATDIDVSFLQNGDLVASIADHEASVRGTAAGTDFDMSVADASTGDIVYGNNRVAVPNLSIPSIKLGELSYKSPDYIVGTQKGAQGVELLNLTLDMEAKLNPDTGSMESIEIKSLKVPTTTVQGLEVQMPAYDATITLPASEVGTIRDLSVSDFTLTPDGDSWAMDGDIGVGGVSLPKVKAVIADTMTATTDITVGKIDVGMLADGAGQTVDVASIDLNNIQGSMPGGTSFEFRKGGGVSVEGVHMNTDAAGENTITIDEASANGLIYDDGNMRVVIDKATLPEGFTMPPSGEMTLPETVIRDSRFMIRDVMALAGGESDSSGGGMVDYSFLDTLDGDVNLSVLINWLPDLKNLHVPIRNGVFDFKKLEKDLPMLYDFAVDFEVEDDQLVLVADPIFRVATFGTWPLDQQEKALANLGKARLSTLANIQMEGSEEESDGGSGGPPVRIRVKDLNADMSMRGPSVIDLGEMGKVTLGGADMDGLLNFTAKGNLDSKKKGRIDLAMKELNIGLDGLNMGGIKINTSEGGIQISNLKDTRLNFDGFSPTSMTGTIEEAIAKGLKVKLPG